MTQIEALARLRMIVDEGTAAKWTDNELYDCLDAGQNIVTQLRLAFQKMMRDKGDRFYEDIYIKDLLTLSTINTTSGTASYNTPSAYIEFAYGSFSPDGGGVFIDLTLLGYEEFRRRTSNAMLQGDSTTKTAYIAVRGSNIDVTPTPSATVTGGLLFYHYAQPSTVASGQDFTLRARTHEAIIEYGAYYAFNKDNDPRAFTHLQNFINQMGLL